MPTPPRVTRTETSITIELPVRAIGKRPGEYVARLGFHVPDRDTEQYMDMLRDFVRPYLPPEPWPGPLEGVIWAYYAPPSSWSRKKRDAALRDELRPDVAPDADNISKAVLDALQPTKRRPRGAMRNDGQVTDLEVHKRYAAEDRLVVTLRRLDLGRGLQPTQPSLL